VLRRQAAAKRGAVAGLLLRAVASATDRGRIPPEPTAAVDATGLDRRHASRYFVQRAGGHGTARTYAKWTVACDTARHFFAAATVTVGPANDSPQFPPVLSFAAIAVDWDRVMADAAFDSEAHHRLAREELGIRSSVIPIHPRGHDGPPGGEYRGQMARRFRPKPEGGRSERVYGQRWAVESGFSRHKRVRGSARGGKSDASREREGYLRVLTHNLMLLAAVK
jgi:hypothetical protein